MTRPRKSLDTLADWLGGDLTDLAWSAAGVVIVLAAAWSGLIRV